jgi:hypothetical protein
MRPTDEGGRDEFSNRDSYRFRCGGTVFRNVPSEAGVFEEVDDPLSAYQHELTRGALPGFGERLDTCGNEVPHFCKSCGKPATDENGELVQIERCCWRKRCSRCGAGWAARAAYPGAAKLESLRKQVYSERDRSESPAFYHVVVSVPDFATSHEDADGVFFRMVTSVMDEITVGGQGGGIIHHSYSRTGQEDELGWWTEKMFTGLKWEDFEEEIELSHHAHVVVLADSVDNQRCKAVAEETGMTIRSYENGKDENASVYSKVDLAKTLTYLMSHARVAEDANTVRPYGRLDGFPADDHIKAQMRGVAHSMATNTLGLTLKQHACHC